MPQSLSGADLLRIEQAVSMRLKVKRASTLFYVGDPFVSLYMVRIGVFKTCVTTQDGRVQVTGFQMPGDILGLDGIISQYHPCHAVALEDAEVCVMPFHALEALSQEVKPLQQYLHRIMSRKMVHDQGVMLLLGSMRADERVATFLSQLMQRLHAQGFSRTALVLRMTREEIGSYLGLKLETVSRTFSKLAGHQIIAIHRRHVEIINPQALQRIVTGAASR
jgi:CRP/FNR family transcriptional regulator